MNSLHTKILLTIMGVVCFIIITLMIVVQWQTTVILQNVLKSNATNLLNSITSAVENQYYSIQFHRKATFDHRKQELKNVVDISYSVLGKYFDNYRSGIYSQEQAQELAKQSVKKMRWANDVGYFWINDTTMPTPIMIMHPTLPELDGKTLDSPVFDCALGRNENLFRAINHVSKKNGSGYVDYLWPKPTQDGELTNIQPKLSYVRLFEQWQWIIGSGVYIDDIEYETQQRLDAVIKELRQTFKNMTISENSYMFMFTSEKEMLIHPKLEGQDVIQLVNPITGRFILDEIMLAEKMPEKTLEYRWGKLTGSSNELFNKKLYVSYFEPLKWYICIAYYEDEANAPVKDLGLRMITLAMFFITLSLVLSFLLARSLTTPLKKLSTAAEIIDQKGLGATKIPISGSKETRELGQILSQTLATIGEKEHSLKTSEKNLKKAEAKLKQQLSFTESLLSAIPTPVFFKDINGKFIGCNQAFSEFVGITSDSICGKTSFDLWPRELAEEYHSMDMQLLSSSEYQTKEFKILGSDNKLHDVILNKDVFRDDKGKVVGLVGSFIDLTDRLRAEQDVRASELKYRQLIENANDAILIVQNEKILFANNKGYELTGYDAGELSKISFQKLIHYDDLAMVVERYTKRIKGDTRIPSSYSLKIVSKDNTIYTVLLTTVLIDWHGSPAVLCFVRDITQEKKLEEVLFHAQKMKAIGTLAGGVAHDFNNLLMGIQGRSALMKINFDPSSPNHEHVDAIDEYVQSAASLTRQLLGTAREGKYDPKPTDLNLLIEKSSAMFGRTRKEINIQKHLSRSQIISDVDRQQLEQVFLNMYVNAWQAMPEGGELHLHTTIETVDNGSDLQHQLLAGQYAKISIIDTGIGMDESTRIRIFDPFFTTRDKSRGTGLGLASAYGIINNHNGLITVNSESGHGTKFNIYLPLSNFDPFQEDLSSAEIITGTETILLIDDEEIIIEVGQEILQKLGYSVVVARGGKEAIDFLKTTTNTINLVILDLIMPGMDGKITFDQIRKLDPSLPVILSSGYSMDGHVTEIMRKGCNGFIQKPFDLSSISQKIREVIESQ